MTFSKKLRTIGLSEVNTVFLKDGGFPSMVRSLEEFLSIVTPEQRQFITDCIKQGLADYDNPELYGEGARRIHTPSVRATIRNCHIVDYAKRSLLEKPDIHIKIREKRNRVLFIFSDKICVSFKKFDQNLRTSNFPTQQALAFETQKPVVSEPTDQMLFDMTSSPDLTNVFAGYRSNKTETEYELLVTCPVGKRNEWHLTLSGSAKILDFFSAVDEVDGKEVKIVDEVVEKARESRVRLRSKSIRKDVTNE